MATSAKVVKGMTKMVDNGRAQLEQAQDERDRLAEFVKYIIEKIKERDNLEPWDCQAKALELGLIVESEEATEEDEGYRYPSWLEEIEPVMGTY